MNSLIEKLMSFVNRHTDVPDAQAITTAAFCRETGEKPLHPGRRRVKESYTSHWDLDYLPRSEADAVRERAERRQ
ncbi:MAG: hypothetical protein Kow0065_13230 [Methylomicrobium sp.]